MSGNPSGVDNTFRRKFDKEEYLERARQRERDEKDEARRGKDRGPPVQRQPLKHRDYEVDLESRLGKTQEDWIEQRAPRQEPPPGIAPSLPGIPPPPPGIPPPLPGFAPLSRLESPLRRRPSPAARFQRPPPPPLRRPLASTRQPLRLKRSSAAAAAREQPAGESWSEEEHKNFLLGLKNLGRGDWRGISRNYVASRTPTQVASHAQKYFIRQTNHSRRKRRSSLFDMVIDDSGDQPLSRSSSQEIPLSRSSSQEVEEYVDDLRHVTAPATPPAHVPVLTSVSVPPVPVMAPPAPVPVLTYASAPPQVQAMAHQPEGSQSVGSSSYTGEAGMVMPQVIAPYGYPMMFPSPHYAQAFYPVPYYGYAPMFYGPPISVQASSPGTVQASHEPVRPVAIHSSPPVNVEDLYSMSELNLKGDSSTNGVAPKSPLPPKPNGRPERQSAFHETGHANGLSNGLIPAK